MEFIALDNPPVVSVVGDANFHQLVEHRYTLPNALFLDVALPELQSNSVTKYMLLASPHTYYGTPFGSLFVKNMQ
jgi:hypothetical protein